MIKKSHHVTSTVSIKKKNNKFSYVILYLSRRACAFSRFFSWSLLIIFMRLLRYISTLNRNGSSLHLFKNLIIFYSVCLWLKYSCIYILSYSWKRDYTSCHTSSHMHFWNLWQVKVTTAKHMTFVTFARYSLSVSHPTRSRPRPQKLIK